MKKEIGYFLYVASPIIFSYNIFYMYWHKNYKKVTLDERWFTHLFDYDKAQFLNIFQIKI